MQPASPRRINDPLQYLLPLPLAAEYYPLGFPLQIAANSKVAMSAAEQMWSRFPKLFDAPPMRIKITVSGTGEKTSRLPKHAPILRGQEHLFSIVADAGNFVAADLNAGFGHVSLTPDVASNREYVRYHFLEPLAYVLIASSHVAFVHASCVALDGCAILLCGGSGSGKTCAAYACARRGWTFLAGDAAAIAHRGDIHRVLGRPFEIRFRHTAQRLFPELGKFPPVLRPNGKTDVEVDPGDLGITTDIEGRLKRLVFLERAAAPAAPLFKPCSPQAARLELEEGICFGDDAIRQRQGQTLDRLAQLPAVRLRYSDPHGAERALRALLREKE